MRLAFTLLLLAAAARAETLLVVNKADAMLEFVDTKTMTVVAKVPTGEGPHEVTTTSDGSIAVVANYGTGPKPGASLSIIDVASRREIKRLQLPVLRPHGLYPIGSRIYFTAEGSRVAGLYDAKRDAIEAIDGTGAELSHMVVVTADEKKVFTANIGSDSVSVLDLHEAPRKIGLKLIAAGKGPEAIDLSPDESELWVASRMANGGIAVIDPKTDTVIATIPTTTKVANRLKFTRDGKNVLLSDAGGTEAYVFDRATRKVVKTITTPDGPSGIVIDPDGKHAYVACASANKVIAIDLTTWTITGSVATGNVPDGLALTK